MPACQLVTYKYRQQQGNIYSLTWPLLSLWFAVKSTSTRPYYWTIVLVFHSNMPPLFPHLSLYSIFTNVIHWIWNHFQLKSMNATISPWWLNLRSIWINQQREKRGQKKKGGKCIGRSGTKLDPHTPQVSLLPEKCNRLNPWCCCGLSSMSQAVPNQIPPKPERSKNQCHTPSD